MNETLAIVKEGRAKKIKKRTRLGKRERAETKEKKLKKRARPGKRERAETKEKILKKRARPGKREKAETKEKILKHLAMASGFQGACSTRSSTDQDDDVLLLYDKQAEKHARESSRITKQTKFCLSRQYDINLQEIPLPPENWVSNCKNDSIRLKDIPLPPSPNTYERLEKQSKCAVGDDDEVCHLKKLLKNFRKWELTDLGQKMQSEAQKLLETHNELYRRNSPGALQWKYRSEVLFNEIQEKDADILCLQEVQASHLSSFYKNLEDLGYKGIFKQRSNGNVDGCAIYYKTSKFKLMDSATVEYFQDYLPGGCILDRNNVAIIARLALQNSVGCENEIVVATTHLLYNPKRHDIKLAQTQVLLAELDRMSYTGVDKKTGKPMYLPTVVTGDFNLEPDTAVYRLIVNGSLCYSNLTARYLHDAQYGQALQDFLLPFELQISNTCQHLGLLLHRLKTENRQFNHAEAKISSLTKLYNTDMYKSLNQFWQKQSQIPLLYQEDFCGRVQRGCLSHDMNFQSVYKHKQMSSSSSSSTVYDEATTHQNGWVTVDYIFYSGKRNEKNHCVEEGPLKLLARYTLPSCAQCYDLQSLPNAVCGSDHLLLMARFCLTSQ